MSGHTPGPWAVWTGHGSVFAVDPDTTMTASQIHCYRKEICEMSDDFDSEEGGLTTQQKANARLIAAAPDLLAALVAARRQMTNQPYNKPRIGMEAECALADEAIAKARGTR